MATETVISTLEGIELPAPGDWATDPAHSSVAFVARYLMLSKVRGSLKEFSGTVHVAEAPEESRVELTIDAASIDTGNQMRDDHLRSPDFLDVANHPEIRFVSTGFTRTGPAAVRVTGDLTIRGVTRSVTLEGEYLGLTGDPWGNRRIALTASGQIDREEYGLTWNQALETGGVLVGRQIGIEVEVQALQQKEGERAA